MAKIFGLELKNLHFNAADFEAELFLNGKRVAHCNNYNENYPYISLKWDNNTDIKNIYNLVKGYFKKYPKYHFDETIECKMTALIFELLDLCVNEKELIEKKVKHPKAKMVYMSFNKRIEPSVNLDNWICFTNWSGNLEERIKNNYNPVEFTIYSEEKDFVIE